MSQTDWGNNRVNLATYYPQIGDVYSFKGDGIINQYFEYSNFGLPALTDPKAERSGTYADFTPDGVTFTFKPRSEGYAFSSAPFNGYDVTSTDPADVALLKNVTLVKSNVSGLDQQDIAFDGDHFTVNLSGTSIPANTSGAFTLDFGFGAGPASQPTPTQTEISFDRRPIFVAPDEVLIRGSVSDPSASVEVFDGSDDLGSAQVEADGGWTFDGKLGERELTHLTAVATSPSSRPTSASSPYVVASGPGEGLPALLEAATDLIGHTEDLASTLTVAYDWLANAEHAAGVGAVSHLARSVAHSLGADKYLSEDAAADHDAKALSSYFEESARRFDTTATVLGVIGDVYETANGAAYLSAHYTPGQAATADQIEAQQETERGLTGLAATRLPGIAALGGVIAHVKAAGQYALQDEYGKAVGELARGSVVFGFAALGAEIDPLNAAKGADIGASLGDGALKIEDKLIEKAVDSYVGVNDQPLGHQISNNFLPLFYHPT